MSPSRPYLIRALYEWILDNQHTPYLLVDVAGDGVSVPKEYIDNGKIVLNLSPTAVQKLQLGNEQISFNARFSGEPQEISFPVARVLAIYARENGQGMMFNDEGGIKPPPDSPDGERKRKKSTKKPQLKVVK